MPRQGAMRQGMCRHNASSEGNAMRRQGVMRRQRAMCRQGAGVIANLSPQCVVSVSTKSHTQAAGALCILFDFSIFRFFETQNETFFLFNFTTFRRFDFSKLKMAPFHTTVSVEPFQIYMGAW